MWQAKCFEEQGEIGAGDRPVQAAPRAHGDPRLRDLQRNVGYFYIVALAKRKEYALAADEADAMAREVQPPRGTAIARKGWACCWSWPRPSTPRCPRSTSRPIAKAAKQIIDAVAQVVRYASPFKNEALALLKKYKPSAAVKAEELIRLTLQGRHGAGRRGDRLARVGPRHHPAARRPCARPIPSARSTTSTWPGTTWPSATT